MKIKTTLLLIILIIIGAMTRLIPHPPNFAPIGAMSLLGAAYFQRKWLAFAIPMIAFWISDLVLNNVVYASWFDGFILVSKEFAWTLMAFALITMVAIYLLKKVNIQRIFAGSLLASGLFFLISNFGHWASGVMYPKTLEGLAACYTAGIPFIWNTLAGDLFFTTVMFGAFYLISKQNPVAAKSIA